MTIPIAIAVTFGWVHGQSPGALVRAPMQKEKVSLESPKSYLMRTRVDPKTGQSTEYDPKPEIVILNKTSGVYGLRWIGYDGAQKTIVYQRPDMIDVVVKATIERTPQGRYSYTYEVQNLSSSVENLSGFAVQSLSGDVVPSSREHVHVGRMSAGPLFAAGNWTRFAPLDSGPPVRPGRSITFRLESRDSPGLVECRVHGGPIGLKGAGEEPPMELENALPGYRIWPHGHTIGPVSRLAGLSGNAKAAALLEWLPVFQRAGWIGVRVRQRYETTLKRGILPSLAPDVEADYKTGGITSEVLAVIRGLTVPRSGSGL